MTSDVALSGGPGFQKPGFAFGQPCTLPINYKRMLFLPTIHGRFPVGVTTFATPVRPARSIGLVKLRNAGKQGTPDSALYLEEVAFSVYYPADVDTNSKKGVPWFIRPIKESLLGFSAFLGVPSWLLWPVVYLFGALLKIPAYPNAPLLSPEKAKECSKDAEVTQPSQWPLVIFSHGLGGTRTAYSQFCSRLAASGRVVLALEHRDGTGPACLSRSWNLEGKSKPRTLFYLREADIHWDENEIKDTRPLPLRAEQLAFRHNEIYIAYSTFCRFINQDATLEFDTIDASPFDTQSWKGLNGSGQQNIRFDDRVVLAGHSFGGCTVLSLLSTKPLEGYELIPVERAVILDPWLEPLPSPGPVPLLKDGIPDSKINIAEASVRSSLETAVESSSAFSGGVTKSPHPSMLVINSENFTLWKDHYARLLEVVAGWEPKGGRIMTIVGSEHVSFSDFPVLPVFKKKFARPILDTITELSLSFLDDKLDHTLRTIPTTTMEVEVIGVKKDGKPKRRLIGNPGDVIAQ
ncbi:hypothetical protein GALMADRAFT_133340 [Galerina marginata CBS 339.88]|uniref:1-alkyl-2-acetylglycerophosphocholine esterase n=1 Tax=Galerina marginata (strain CBS 339.88) TaxID=685588 RepID=A0A067TL97_GALM3|nr:hypothetical protein GALMADRAFT_133340 [Galerina marginata CBS 339.88]